MVERERELEWLDKEHAKLNDNCKKEGRKSEKG